MFPKHFPSNHFPTSTLNTHRKAEMPKETESESRYLYKPQKPEPETPNFCRASEFHLSQQYARLIRGKLLCTHLILNASDTKCTPQNNGLRAEVKKAIILAYCLIQEGVETTPLCPLLHHSLRKSNMIHSICIRKNRNCLLVSDKKKKRCMHQEKVYDSVTSSQKRDKA